MKARKVKAPIPTEAQDQVKVIVYAKKRGLLCYAVPNGGKRSYLEAVRLKQQGVSPGVPDMCFPMARKGYHGLYIELKRQSGGVVSDEQFWWCQALTKEGYKVMIAHGFDEAVRAIEDYFG